MFDCDLWFLSLFFQEERQRRRDEQLAREEAAQV